MGVISSRHPPRQPAIPHGRTARRLEWTHLPPPIRAAVAQRLGSPVVSAESQTAGYTPGFASVLTCADGTRHFVKAASLKAQRPFAEGYRIEAARLRTLPPTVPAPRLQWLMDTDDWVVLGIEYVEGRQPARPWTPSDLEAASAMLVDAAAALTPAPGLGLETFAEEHASMPSLWEAVGPSYPDLPPERVAEAARLALRMPEATAGETLVHLDVRDDNLLITPEGRVYLCDWNWPVRGAAWIDSLALLIGPRGDGLDVERHLAAHPLLAPVPPDDVDTVLALLAGYFLYSATLPVPTTSPYLREGARWQGEVCWDWLSERRAW